MCGARTTYRRNAARILVWQYCTLSQRQTYELDPYDKDSLQGYSTGVASARSTGIAI